MDFEIKMFIGLGILIIMIAVLISAYLPQSNQKIYFQENTPYGTVSVNGDSKYLEMSIDGRTQCFYSLNSENLSESKIAEYATSILAYKKEIDVLNIGLGCGITLSKILKAPNLKQVDVVEINKVMKKVSSEYFGRFTMYPLENPKTNLIIADGVDHLRYTDKKYDLIIIDVENPEIIYSSPFYTSDIFREAKNRLKKDGILALWAFTGDTKYHALIYNTLKTSFNCVYYKHWDNDFYIASNYPINQELIKSTKYEQSMQKTIKEMEVEINTIDRSIIDTYYNDAKPWNIIN